MDKHDQVPSQIAPAAGIGGSKASTASGIADTISSDGPRPHFSDPSATAHVGDGQAPPTITAQGITSTSEAYAGPTPGHQHHQATDISLRQTPTNVRGQNGAGRATEDHAQRGGLASGGSRGRGRGRGRPRGSRGSILGRRGSKVKRRRDEDEIRADDSPSDTDPEDLVEIKAEDDDGLITNQATRSGRAVTKPNGFSPPPPSEKVLGPAQIAGLKRKRQSLNRKNPDLAVCKVCIRPHSPATNMIVFCDGCNTPFHRYCHHPPIQQEVVEVREMEWYCAECEADHEVLYDIDTFVCGEGLTDDKKRHHLSKLPARILIDLLLRASHVQPSLPLVPPSAVPSSKTTMPPPPHPSRQRPSTLPPPHTAFSIPPSKRPHPNDPSSAIERPPDEELEQAAETGDPPACYVRPGFGLARLLPPESVDTAILVDDNVEVYTHIVQVDPKVANETLFGKSGDGHVDLRKKDRSKGSMDRAAVAVAVDEVPADGSSNKTVKHPASPAAATTAEIHVTPDVTGARP